MPYNLWSSVAKDAEELEGGVGSQGAGHVVLRPAGTHGNWLRSALRQHVYLSSSNVEQSAGVSSSCQGVQFQVRHE